MKSPGKLFLNGRKSVLELLQNEQLRPLILTVYLSSSQRFLISECEKYKIDYSVKSKSGLNVLRGELNAKYGDIFAFLKSKEQMSFSELLQSLSASEDPELIVMLDKLQDPYNFGAIIRTCVGAGVNYLIYPSVSSVKLNSIVLKTSQGYALKLNLIEVPNLSNALERLKKLGFWSYGASLVPGSKLYFSASFEPRSVLVLGNEGDGISRRLESLVDGKITIPLKNEVNSLNVSVACGILVYEGIKQLNIPNSKP